MNILLIGNGFDLAHGLPTSYGDFLDYIEEKISNYNLPRYRDELKNNLWIDGFLRRRINLGYNWIDLESEISLVVQCLDDLYSRDYEITCPVVSKSLLPEYKILYKEVMNQVNENKLYSKNNKLEWRSKSDIIEVLYKDLNKFIGYLEIYLQKIIEEIPMWLSPDINLLKINRVLSFNYTSTFSTLYDNDNLCEYDYIHGKISESTNNMVLGIDEYLSDSEKNIRLDFVRFKKYFQRIQKKTGCTYKLWIEDVESLWCKENKEPVYEGGKLLGYDCPKGVNLYIFGHSLDVTDKDILKELILQKGVTTTIFYHDEDSYAEKITNLIKVIGQDNLTKFVHGTNPKIKFQLQEDMIPAPVLATK